MTARRRTLISNKEINRAFEALHRVVDGQLGWTAMVENGRKLLAD